MIRLMEELEASPQALRAQYDTVFGLVVPKECPPYETEYYPTQETFGRSQQMADVAGFYQAFGIEPAQSSPERPDHLALELEFMAFLLLKRRQAIAATDHDPEAGEQASICDRALRDFFRDHLAWWLPAFAAGLRRKAGARLSSCSGWRSGRVDTGRMPPSGHLGGTQARPSGTNRRAGGAIRVCRLSASSLTAFCAGGDRHRQMLIRSHENSGTLTTAETSAGATIIHPLALSSGTSQHQRCFFVRGDSRAAMIAPWPITRPPRDGLVSAEQRGDQLVPLPRGIAGGQRARTWRRSRWSTIRHGPTARSRS